ncbi:phage tail sheath family protein [Paenibacillus sp. JNUCC32]|uniref:phage tail sheath family protein n=1 Tax=Paenibacillus sp. JNUCC32 TaxID=2777984 RepID=UPI001787B188|nr:phage tail sheath family protein [Paenibacillus sp. JNUCC-32]QOT12961.1 phage tail sheath family protein [Paenibacillus sp. JNUCC-32]
MAERHGVYVTEVPASILTPVSPLATIPVVFGTAPIHMSKLASPPVNVPFLAESWEQYKDALGYSEDWENYTLCEFAFSHFQLYKQSPAVFINVLDPEMHKESVNPSPVTLTSGTGTINVQGILINTVKVSSTGQTPTDYVRDTDYTLSFNSAGHLILTAKPGGAMIAESSVNVGYDKLKPEDVDSGVIVGGTDGVTGAVTGLEVLKQVFPRLRVVPGLILAPGFSHDPVVGAVMVAKSRKINGNFNAQAITDIPGNQTAAQVDKWKEDNLYTDKAQFNTWPRVTKSGRTYRLSTHLAGVICQTDAENDGVPYRSPSNKALHIDGIVLDDGKVVALGPDEAELINAEGIVTALNFIGGFRSWGNRTGAFPDAIDPQSSFIPVRRMFDWWNNTIILTQWMYVDDPANKRLVEAVVDSLNIRLNGLQSSGFILGGRIEFNKQDNPKESTMNGKLKFRNYFTPPSPGQELEFMVEYDAEYLSAI